MNGEMQESNTPELTYDDNEDALLYAAAELDEEPAGGLFVFIAAAMLLASHFYALPFIKSPWGYTTHMRLDDVMTVVLFLCVFFGAKNNYPNQKTKAGRLMILIAIGVVLSYAVSKLFARGLLYSQLYAIWQTARYLNYIVVFFLAARVIYTPKRLIVLMWVVFFGGLFVALYGLGQYYGFVSVYRLAEMFKETGTFGQLAEIGKFVEVLGPLSYNHGYCGTMLGMVLFFVWALFYGQNIFAKVILAAGSGIIVYALMLTSARAAMYAMPLAAMATMLFLKGKLNNVFLLAVALIVAYFVLGQFQALKDRVLLYEGFVSSTGGYRLYGWRLILGWLARHPEAWLTGIGVGNWMLIISPETHFRAAHNNYIHFLMEGGVIGLMVFLLALWMAVKYSYQVAKSPIPELARWGQAMFTVVVFLAISAISQENFVPSPAFGSLLSLFLFLLGVTTWAKEYVDERALLPTAEYASVEPAISSGGYI